MFTTAVKTAIIEALDSGFSHLSTNPVNTSLDLVPNSITIEYPLAEVEWPAIFVQFRTTKVQWQGLHPDQYAVVSGGITISGVNYPAQSVTRTGYFEGNIDLQIMALHSEERDKLLDSVNNLVLMGSGSPASNAFYSSLLNNDLVGLTILPSTYTPLGDSVSLGTPFSPEELTYEGSIRMSCIGDFYETKYDYLVPELTEIITTATASGNNSSYDIVIPYPSQ